MERDYELDYGDLSTPEDEAAYEAGRDEGFKDGYQGGKDNAITLLDELLEDRRELLVVAKMEPSIFTPQVEPMIQGAVNILETLRAKLLKEM